MRRDQDVKQVEETRGLVLQSAQREFLDKGYEKASLRSIAQNAGVTTGALYVRFPNKSALFAALVEPVSAHLLGLFRTGNDQGFEQLDEGRPEDMWSTSEDVITRIVDYIFEHKEPFDLLDEVEKELRIRVRPLAFPISNGPTFKGVYNLYEKNLSLFTSDEKLTADASTAEISDLASQELEGYIGAKFAEQLRSDVELVEGVYDEFDREAYLNGELAPVFFGSAVNNFGVRELLDCFVRIAPSPRPAPTETRLVEAAEPKMSGFIFKIHANMDPNHRDRIAFVKVCSGVFRRNTNYLHVGLGKNLKFSTPTAFMASKKSIIDEAYPGDIVGLHDTGNFKIGDTFTEGEKLRFTGIPSFAPEQFRYIENADPLKFKQLAKGVDQLMDEGVAQLFTSSLNGRKIIGTVGALQFEIIQYRLEHEYNAACRWEPISIYKACWIESDNAAQLADFKRRKHTNMAVDKHGRDVFLADTSYGLALAQDNFKEIRFHFTSEF